MTSIKLRKRLYIVYDTVRLKWATFCVYFRVDSPINVGTVCGPNNNMCAELFWYSNLPIY